MAVSAYILIQTEVGKAAQVASEVDGITGVVSAEDVTGPYDVIARAEAETVDELGKMVVSRVQMIDGITRTLTCPVVHLYKGQRALPAADRRGAALEVALLGAARRGGGRGAEGVLGLVVPAGLLEQVAARREPGVAAGRRGHAVQRLETGAGSVGLREGDRRVDVDHRVGVDGGEDAVEPGDLAASPSPRSSAPGRGRPRWPPGAGTGRPRRRSPRATGRAGAGPPRSWPRPTGPGPGRRAARARRARRAGPDAGRR